MPAQPNSAARILVSNPFSAGRDSSVVLHTQMSDLALKCFKPLQRGAGFLWFGIRYAPRMDWKCFKPLQRGAGFLWVCCAPKAISINMFQTPSARGGIPLRIQIARSSTGGECFKPLQRGAGFLCGQPVWDARRPHAGFKPLQRGAGFLCLIAIVGFINVADVSNPFSAGRDSSGVRITGRAVWRTTRRHRSITIARSAQRSLCMWPGSPIMLV